jgi:hypothetical protein
MGMSHQNRYLELEQGHHGARGHSMGDQHLIDHTWYVTLNPFRRRTEAYQIMPFTRYHSGRDLLSIFRIFYAQHCLDPLFMDSDARRLQCTRP